MCRFVEVAYGTPRYEELVALRCAELRAPLGLGFSPEQLAEERGWRHFALVAGHSALVAGEGGESGWGPVVGCLVATPLGDGALPCRAWRLRQMAIAAPLRGRGLGRRLMADAERWLRSHGATRLTLHARLTAEGFYAKLGYRPVGEPFVEVTLPHQAMEKSFG